MDTDEHRSTTLFRDYLRIRTDHPEPDYATCRKFLEDYAAGNGWTCRVFDAAPNRPVVIMKVEGKKPELPSILLNSHTDVACIGKLEDWKYEPFSAHKDEKGDIYARGSQDMKCVGIQHMEAMRELCEAGDKLERTVYLSFQPDEEIGGDLGMRVWIDSDDFKSLNVGCAMDEGLANTEEEMKVYYCERMMRWGFFVAKGENGYGSCFVKNAPGPKIHKILGKILEFREKQENRLINDSTLTDGDVCTVNISALQGGEAQLNMTPEEMRVGFDLRVPPKEQEAVDLMLEEWCRECDVTIVWDQFQKERGITTLDSNNSYWNAFSKALEESDVKYKVEQFPGITDMRFVRNAGLPAIGFSPMNNTPLLLLGPNESLNEGVFLRGVQIYKNVIKAVANVL